MKTLTKYLLVAAVAGLTALNVAADNEDGPPGQQKKEKGVPPGLQKKGGLPPGQAKKRGNSNSSDEKTAAAATNAPSGATTVKAREPVPPTPAPPEPTQVAKPAPEAPKGPVDPQIAKPTTGTLPPPGDSTAKVPDATAKPAPRLSREAIEKGERLQRYVADLDAIGRKPEVRERLMVRLYKNADVPLSTLEAQQKANPNLGMGGLYVVHAIASRSRHSADSILAEVKAGKDWATLAHSHKVTISDVIESARGALESARAAEKEAARR